MNREPLVYAGTAGAPLATKVAAVLGVPSGRCLIERYAGGERRLELQDPAAGRDVFLIQPTSEPIERNLFELLLLADACLREGASRITGVVPYLGYGRQDRRSGKAAPVGGRVLANVLASAPLSRLVLVDLHAPAMEAFFPMPVDHLSSFPALINALAACDTSEGVIVAPDAGATKLATGVAEALNLPVALVQKTRLGGSDVVATSVSGDVRGRRAIIVDDMVTTGGTIEAAVRRVLDAGSQPEVTVAVVHGVFEAGASARLGSLPIRRFLVTDSVPCGVNSGIKAETVSIAPLLAEAIVRIHEARPLTDILSQA